MIPISKHRAPVPARAARSRFTRSTDRRPAGAEGDIATKLLVIGNVVEDRTPRGWIPGGPVLYAAHMARTLGADVTIATMLPTGYPPDVLAGLTVRSSPATGAARYANIYDADGDREQLLLYPGEAFERLPELPGPFDVVLLAPAFHELDGIVTTELLREWYPGAVRGATLQGTLRDRDGERVVAHEDGPERAEDLVGPEDFAFFSDEDTDDTTALAARLVQRGATAFVTRGHRGARRYAADGSFGFQACPAHPIDPTGAGDSFAAAFLVRYAETGDRDEATWFALAAAACSTEHSGPLDQPSRADIEARRQECLP